MKEPVTISQIKAAARGSLPGRLGSAAGIVLLYTVCLLSLSAFPASVAPSHAVLGPVFFLVLQYMVEILIQMMAIGVRFRFLKLLFDLSPAPGDMGMAFRGNADRAVGLCARRALWYTLCLLPASVLSLRLPMHPGTGDLVPFLLVYTLGRIAVFFLRMHLQWADYLYSEYPVLDAAGLLRVSRRLIRGSRLRLILFYLSYLPLHLLGLISFGITEPLVLTYLYAGEAAFYADLVRRHAKK